MYTKRLMQFLIYSLCLIFTEAYFPKQLIPKRLRVKMCEKNPTLSICDSLIDSPKYFPFDQYSKWDICKFRTDLSFCQRFPAKMFMTEFKNEEIIPLTPYESSRENSGFVEPIFTTETTKVTKIFTSTKSPTTVTVEKEVEGSGEEEAEEEIKTTEALVKKQELSTSTITTNMPLIEEDS